MDNKNLTSNDDLQTTPDNKNNEQKVLNSEKKDFTQKSLSKDILSNEEHEHINYMAKVCSLFTAYIITLAIFIFINCIVAYILFKLGLNVKVCFIVGAIGIVIDVISNTNDVVKKYKEIKANKNED